MPFAKAPIRRHDGLRYKPVVKPDLNRLLLELYRLTGSGPSLAFGAAVFNLFADAIGFDSGLWATFTLSPDGPRPHSMYLHNLPARMIEEYEQVKQYDVLNQQSVANCGRTFNVSLDQMEATAHPAIITHARRWGMEHTLATMILESPLNLYTAFCVYRQRTSRAFSERERRITEGVVPHIVQAWHLNELHFLDAPAAPARAAPRARALIDRFGVLHNAEPGLPALLRREMSDWQGPSVPSTVLAALRDGATEFKGRAVVVSLLRELPDGRLLISARARVPVDALTQRERTVARLFAAGKTHKQIAHTLNTSPSTVRTQIQTIYLKLGVRTKIDLATHVAYAS